MTSRAGLAATPAHYVYRVESGSAHYVVYARFVDGDGQGSDPGTLFLATAHGRSRRLSSVTRFDDAASLDGSMLVYDSGTSMTKPPKVLWRNLSTGGHGVVPAVLSGPGVALFRDWYYITAAPHGWVWAEAEAAKPRVEKLYLQNTAGHVTHLGSPDPGGAHLEIAVGGNTLVATSDRDQEYSNGTARVMSFDHPGRFHTILGPNRDGQEVLGASATTTRVALFYATDKNDSERLYSTSGTLLASYTRFSLEGIPAVLHHSLAWIESGNEVEPHQLWILSPTHRITTTPGHIFDAITPVAALGEVVAMAHDRRELLLVTSAKHRRVIAPEAGPSEAPRH